MVDWDWNRVVFDHVKVTVADAAASIAFYTTILEPLQIPPLWESERGAQFANLVVFAGDATSGPIHMAFVAQSREQVDAFHRAGVDAGYPDNGAPGVREQYSSDDALLRGLPARSRRQQCRGRRARVLARACVEVVREL